MKKKMVARDHPTTVAQFNAIFFHLYEHNDPVTFIGDDEDLALWLIKNDAVEPNVWNDKENKDCANDDDDALPMLEECTCNP